VAPRLAGPVLCLGEGEGRNAVFLAAQGLEVTAVDLSPVALDKAQRLAAERGVRITTAVADLADFGLGEARWGAIVSIWCHLPPWLRTKVHRAAVVALEPGGHFVLEAYTPRQLAFDTGGPRSEDLLYEPQSLRDDLAGLELLRCEELERKVHEGDWHRGRSAVVQVLARKP
jgi:SAM-dependent methyltransferase